MRHLIALIFSCFFLIVSSAAMAETVTVKIQDFSFIPNAISINKGDSITWTNQDSAVHSTTQDATLWSSDLRGLHSILYSTMLAHTRILAVFILRCAVLSLLRIPER